MFSMVGMEKMLSMLEEECPMFTISGKQVSVLLEPCQFYSQLIAGCRGAERRIVLSSLYLGNGPLSRQLLDEISKRLESRPHLKLHVLLDCQRASRGHQPDNPSSRSLLLSLVQQYPQQVTVSLYHTPNLRGFIRRVLPQRVNEIIGLQHMKIYLFDDDVVVSGANLNDDYFTTRQDRYVRFGGCRQLCDFYAQLVDTIGQLCFQLTAADRLQLPEGAVHPFLQPYSCYTRQLRDRLLQLMTRWRLVLTPVGERGKHGDGGDTWLFPTVNLGHADIHTDDRVVTGLMRGVYHRGCTYLASGYFNITEHYKQSLLKNASPVHVICAHPTANGFQSAGDLSRFVPHMYTYLLQRFYNILLPSTGGQVKLLEYRRPGWTFHSKGLWCHMDTNQQTPSITVVGSSNYGYRSVNRDLETQVVMVTEHEPLRRALAEERHKLYLHGTPVDGSTFRQPDRHVPYWVRVVSRLIRNFF